MDTYKGQSVLLCFVLFVAVVVCFCFCLIKDTPPQDPEAQLSTLVSCSLTPTFWLFSLSCLSFPVLSIELLGIIS